MASKRFCPRVEECAAPPTLEGSDIGASDPPCWLKPNRVSRARAVQSRGIAQPGSAGVLGTPGRRFKSCCPDHATPCFIIGFLCDADAIPTDGSHDGTHLQARTQCDAVRQRQHQGLGARLRARAAARDRAAHGLDEFGRHACPGAPALRQCSRKPSPIASAKASPIRFPSQRHRRAARSPMPRIFRSSAAIRGRIDAAWATASPLPTRPCEAGGLREDANPPCKVEMTMHRYRRNWLVAAARGATPRSLPRSPNPGAREPGSRRSLR